MNRLWTLILTTLMACEAAPTALRTVADAPQATDARAMTLTAESVGDQRGIAEHVSRHPRAVGTPEPQRQEIWVLPLTDPGQPLGAEVSAWVTHPGFKGAGESPEAWRAELAAGLDGRRVTLKVAVRQGDRNFADSGWGRAIADAEAKHGLRSRPRAPVLFFPAP